MASVEVANIGKIFGEVLRRHRSARNISQEELAFQAGVDRTFVSRLERGIRQPTITTLIGIGQALGVSAADLAGRCKTPRSRANRDPRYSERWYLHGVKHRVKMPDGTQKWYKNEKLGRTRGLAVITADGIQKWYKEGRLHRQNGPAILYPNGTEEWYLNGERHRRNGPAIQNSDGSGDWYEHGIRLPS